MHCLELLSECTSSGDATATVADDTEVSYNQEETNSAGQTRQVIVERLRTIIERNRKRKQVDKSGSAARLRRDSFSKLTLNSFSFETSSESVSPSNLQLKRKRDVKKKLFAQPAVENIHKRDSHLAMTSSDLNSVTSRSEHSPLPPFASLISSSNFGKLESYFL